MLPHLWLIVTFFLLFAATITLHCLLHAAMISHSTYHHATTHAAAPIIDFYLFSFFATTFTLCSQLLLGGLWHMFTNINIATLQPLTAILEARIFQPAV